MTQKLPDRKLAEAYEREAEDLLQQGKLREAASKMQLAANEHSKAEGSEVHAKPLRARSSLFEGLSIFDSIDWAGEFVDTDLDRALSAFQKAEAVFHETGNENGKIVAQGWKDLVLGMKSQRAGEFGLAKRNYEEARSRFLQLEPSDVVRQAIARAETNFLWCGLMEIGKDPTSFRSRRGEIIKNYELLKKNHPAEADVYDAQFATSEAFASFLNGQDALRRWDYDEAEKAFHDTEIQLSNWPRVQAPLEAVQMRLQSTMRAFELLNRAGRYEAQGIRSLLENADLKEARDALRVASEVYRQAEEAFAEARYPGGFITPIIEFARTTKERAQVASELTSKSLKEITFGIGKWFIIFGLGSLGILTWLNTYLNVAGEQVLFFSLLFGVIGGFGLRSPDILEALQPFFQPDNSKK